MRSADLWPAFLSQILSTRLEIQSLMLSWYSGQKHGTGSASLHCLSMAYAFRIYCYHGGSEAVRGKWLGRVAKVSWLKTVWGNILQFSVAQRNGARWLLTCVWVLKWLFLLGLEILCPHLPATNVPVLQLRETNSPSCVVNTHSF